MCFSESIITDCSQNFISSMHYFCVVNIISRKSWLMIDHVKLKLLRGIISKKMTVFIQNWAILPWVKNVFHLEHWQLRGGSVVSQSEQNWASAVSLTPLENQTGSSHNLYNKTFKRQRHLTLIGMMILSPCDFWIKFHQLNFLSKMSKLLWR